MTTPALSIHQPEAADARSLSDRAYYRIRELIVTLELPPGSLVSERDLMQRLELGRTPVREALRALARERLIEVYPDGAGCSCRASTCATWPGSPRSRNTLEPSAARLAAERATDADRARIDELLAELEQVHDEPDERALIDLDQRIHRHVYRCTHNPFLEETLNEYYVLTLRIWFLALDRVARLEDAIQEHRELLVAIREGDAHRAEEAMKRHVSGFESAIRRVL